MTLTRLIATVKVLSTKGTDPNAKDVMDLTPSDIADAKGYPTVAALLKKTAEQRDVR